MPKEVFKFTKKKCKKNSKVGLLATEGTLKTGVYRKFFDKALRTAFRNDTVETNIVGWTAMGLIEIQRARVRSSWR